MVAAFVLSACKPAPLAAPAPAPEPVIPADGNEFVVAESANTTWNTIGQVLLGIDDVRYEGRAQILYVYDVRYRGEAFLIRARGLPAEAASPGLRTRVDAITSSGAPLRSVATSELLGILSTRVPVEAPHWRARLEAMAKAEQAASKKATKKKRARTRRK
jgi:hypothetical protein